LHARSTFGLAQRLRAPVTRLYDGLTKHHPGVKATCSLSR